MITDIFNYYKEDMPSPESVKRRSAFGGSFGNIGWTDQRTFVMFPNISKVLNLHALPSMASSTTERANSPLRSIIKN